MRIITVVFNNRFSASADNKHYDISYRDSVSNACQCCQSQNGFSAAAASAMDLAISCGSYIIFAPAEVLNCIPENLRSKT